MDSPFSRHSLSESRRRAKLEPQKFRNYGEWQKDQKGPLSYQDRLRLAIDTALAERPADLDEFLNLMKRAGYEVKTVRGGGTV